MSRQTNDFVAEASDTIVVLIRLYNFAVQRVKRESIQKMRSILALYRVDERVSCTLYTLRRDQQII